MNLKDLKINWWLSAALDDSSVCKEFKEDIKLWFKECETANLVSSEYLDTLVDSKYQLEHLKALGVDNWEGYSHYSWDEDD